MRNLLMLASGLVLTFSITALGQITVTNEFMPDSGTALESVNDVLADSAFYASITAGTGGPMQWDFTERTYGSSFFSYVVGVGSTPSIDSFPDANLVLLNYTAVDTAWLAYRSDPNSFARQGVVIRGANGESVTVYRNNAPEWIFPISYNDQWVGYHHWTQFDADTYTEYLDTVYNAVTAWGTARYHSFLVPCLRVMSHERFTYKTYNYSDSLLSTNYSDIYTANFIGAGFNSLVTASRTVIASFSSYASYASGSFLGRTTDVSESGILPAKIYLAQNYPNPFNPQTTIQYDLPEPANVTLEIYDILGRKVETLVNARQEAGHHSVIWYAQNCSSGMYFYRIQAAGFSETKRMLLLK